jgi:ABC-type Mn2+/Zn2+ transport system permease subunit
MKNFFKKNWFKIIAIFILLLSFGKWPYSYYQFLRWAILIIGAYSAYLSYEKKEMAWVWIFIMIAVLFNPIIPFYLSRNTWQYIDIIAAILFFISLYFKLKRKPI